MIKEIKYQQKYVRRLVDETIDLLWRSGKKQQSPPDMTEGDGRKQQV